MLNRLVIKNFAIIEDVEINFQEGMNVLIGETGAGKSIIIDALSLLKGEKSLFDKIRNGQTKAIIEGEFYINNPELIKSINEEYDDLIEDNILNVSRSLDISGKSIAKINYRSVPISVLKKIMERIIDIHSQHKNNAYFDESKQITFIDEFLKKTENKSFINNIAKYVIAYEEYKYAIKKLEEMKETKNSIDDLDYLEYQYNELEKANIQENEIEEVEAELKTLESFEEFSSIMKQFDDMYIEASNNLYGAKKVISSVKNEQFDKDIQRFIETYYEMEDAHEVIMNTFSKCAENLSRIDYLKNRKSLFASLKRKYGSSTEEILAKFKLIKEQIDLLNDYEYTIAEQEKVIAQKMKECEVIAEELTKVRIKASNELASRVNKQIHELLLDNADFKIDVSRSELTKVGQDSIIFMIQANKGGKYLPISESASLGETSRINLAIKNVFNELTPAETIIFDEIDTGISGRVAIATSKKLHEISKLSQSIVISHLAPVAASGDHHFFVSKKVENDMTKTQIKELNEDETLREIAKIIAGNDNEDSLNIVKNLKNELNS